MDNISATGEYVRIEPLEADESTTASGIIVHSKVEKRRDDTTLLHRGIVEQIGPGCERVEFSVGDTVLYNPFDEWRFEVNGAEATLVNYKAIKCILTA